MAGQHTERTDRSAGFMQTLSFMSLVQSEVRDLPDFTKLLGEAAVDHVRGPEWSRHSLCTARWTLQGRNGTIEVYGSHANDFGCTLFTRVTCNCPDLGPQPLTVEYGGGREEPSTVKGVVGLVAQWLPMVAKEPKNPFEGALMPKA